MAILIERMQAARGTAAQWTAANPVLLAGEFGWESDTNRMKIGDGSTAWTPLPYLNDPAPLATGSVTLSGGLATVTGLANTTSTTVVRAMNQSASGVVGALFIYARNPGVGFTIKSSSGGDNSMVYWEVVVW